MHIVIELIQIKIKQNNKQPHSFSTYPRLSSRDPTVCFFALFSMNVLEFRKMPMLA